MSKFIAFILIALALVCAAAETVYPQNGWSEKPSAAADPENAQEGGTFVSYLGPSPKSLNYYLDNNVMSAQVFSFFYETLLSRDSETLEYTPWLAKKWSISDDKMTFTFWLDEKARWSDGKPITAEDVLWTYDALVNPKNMTGPVRYQLERLERPEILPDGAIRFKAKNIHWENLSAAGEMLIMPKHAFQNMDFNLINFEFPVVSGPYRIEEFQEGQYLLLKKRPDYWRRDYPANKGVNNFAFLKMRFFEDQQNAFDAFKKGEIDAMKIYSASQWHQIENEVTAVRNHWIVKQEIHNQEPVGMQGFAMNLRRPIFKDVRVRKALAMLIDRAFMNRTMMFNQYFLHKSYMEDLYDAEHPCPAELVPFAPAAARKLLAEAGWTPDPATGILKKDGVEFSFTFLNRSDSSVKFLSVYNEALKSVGIKMSIASKDWSAWAKDMDEYNFDMTWAAWGGSLFKDPEQLWSSKEAKAPGSSNVTGFADERVDALIEEQKGIFEIQKRNDICRKVDAILVSEFPYALLWNINYTRMLYWNKFGTPPKVFGRFGGDPESLWWLDEDRQEELQEAMDTKTPMAAEPAVINW